MSSPAAPDDPPGGEGDGGGPELALPEPVRARILDLAAEAMAAVPTAEIPPPLRKVAKFAPHRRARLGGAAIAAQLASDPVFRQRIAERVPGPAGELAAALRGGEMPAADPVELAALAYLIRPSRWRELVVAAGRTLRVEADRTALAEQVADVQARVTQAEHDRAVARVEADKLRDELGRAREELASLRRENRLLTRSLREAQRAEQRARELLATEKGRAARATTDHDAELRRLRDKLRETEQAAGATRAAARDARAVADARLWLLLETINQAARGLGRELGLQPAERLPGDLVADEHAHRPGADRQPARALAEDDPTRLDQLLTLPRAHLVIDGYNVTKRGFGDLPLERQRDRLVKGLTGLAARTGAEVTVAFDGAERIPTAAQPRGVRVLFSRPGQTADDLIRQLVRAEPDGRPVIVVSSDREVADSVRRAGAYPIASDGLLRWLDRA
jgi:predicted RNA-binding protein with PIN domain